MGKTNDSNAIKERPVPSTPRRMTRKIGSTTYEVSISFSQTSGEDMNAKIIRLIRNDPENKE